MESHQILDKLPECSSKVPRTKAGGVYKCQCVVGNSKTSTAATHLGKIKVRVFWRETVTGLPGTNGPFSGLNPGNAAFEKNRKNIT